MVEGGYTRTNKGQAGGAAPGFDNNDNWALNQLSFFYGGIVVPDNVGAFIQGTYNGPNGRAAYWSWDNADIRLARDTTLAGRELVVGADRQQQSRRFRTSGIRRRHGDSPIPRPFSARRRPPER